MDLVYLISGPRTEELRYSLRSMAATQPHGQVWLAGQPPQDMLSGVNTIHVVKGNDRYRNTSDSLFAACSLPEVSDPFLLMNDDFFCLDEKAHTGWDRGPVTDTLIPYRKNSEYRVGGVDALNLLKRMGHPDPLSYELHIPMVVHKELMKAVLKKMRDGEHSEAWKRTVYGNLAGLKTESREDVKTSTLPFPASDWVSSSNGGWNSPMGEAVKKLYPYPTEYEEES